MSVTDAGAGNQTGFAATLTSYVRLRQVIPRLLRLRLNGHKVELCWAHSPDCLFFRPALRVAAILLSLLMVAWPLAAQSDWRRDQATQLPLPRKATVTGRSSPEKKTTKQQAGSPVKPCRARLARTARIKQAFVASTELRPMAQQLALLRTPEAYAGVTAYAHSHTGEAAAAAYLALGHAYLLDKRYAEAEAALARPGATTENWPTTPIFSTPRPATRPATMPLRRRSCTDLPIAIPKASSMSRSLSSKPTCCWR